MEPASVEPASAPSVAGSSPRITREYASTAESRLAVERHVVSAGMLAEQYIARFSELHAEAMRQLNEQLEALNDAQQHAQAWAKRSNALEIIAAYSINDMGRIDELQRRVNDLQAEVETARRSEELMRRELEARTEETGKLQARCKDLAQQVIDLRQALREKDTTDCVTVPEPARFLRRSGSESTPFAAWKAAHGIVAMPEGRTPQCLTPAEKRRLTHVPDEDHARLRIALGSPSSSSSPLPSTSSHTHAKHTPEGKSPLAGILPSASMPAIPRATVVLPHHPFAAHHMYDASLHRAGSPDDTPGRTASSPKRTLHRPSTAAAASSVQKLHDDELQTTERLSQRATALQVARQALQRSP